MFKFAKQSSNIGAIYGQVFNFYKDVFAKVWYWVFISMLSVNVIQYFVAQYVTQGGKIAIASLPKEQLMFFLIMNFVAFVITTYFIALVVHRMYVLANEVVGVNSFTLVARKWFTLVTVKAMVVVLVLLGLFVVVVPGIVFAGFLAFCIPAVLFEDKSSIGAMKRSVQLVWGNWWRSLAVLVPAGAILFLGAFLPHLLADYAKIPGVILGAISIIYFTIFSVLLYAFILVQYNDLKLRQKPQDA